MSTLVTMQSTKNRLVKEFQPNQLPNCNQLDYRQKHLRVKETNSSKLHQEDLSRLNLMR